MTIPVSDSCSSAAARRFVAAAACVVLLATGTLPAAAQEAASAANVEVRTTSMPIPAAPELVVEDGAIRLGLEDALSIALARNLDLALERFTREQSLLGVQSSQGIFDLDTSFSAELQKDESPSVSQLEGVPVLESDQRTASVGLSQLTPWGGRANFRLFTSRRTTNSADVLVQPTYSASGGFELTQPLLRNFGRLPTERDVLVARLSSGISREDFELRVSDILLQVETAYWNVVEARDQLVVARESLKLAEDLHGRNKVQVEVGTLAPIELVQSEATIALRQEGIISSEAALRDSVDELLRLLNLPEAMAQGLDVVPLTAAEVPPISIDLDAALAQARDGRPELRAQRLAVEQLEIDAKFRRNQALPRTDLTASYGSAGVGGRGAIPLPDGSLLILDTDLSDALSDVAGRDFIGWSVGVNFAYPLQNRTARAQRAIADLALESGGARLAQLDLSVTTEVRTAARGVRTAAQQIESARATRRLQERNLEAEQKRYENGMSDSFRIAQIQNDVADARSREVIAVTNYRKAVARYRQSIGQLLEEDGVMLVGPEDEMPETQRRGFFSLFR